MAINEAENKTMIMEEAASINFNDEEETYIKAAALQNYLITLEANTIRTNAMRFGELDHYTLANGIIDSGASAILVTSKYNISKEKPTTQVATADSEWTEMLYNTTREDKFQ